MQTIDTIESVREQRAQWREQGMTVGLVPTMGCLHEGHRALIRDCVYRADKTVVSIFVNPAQFGPGEDYEAYPRNMEHDKNDCAQEGVDIVFSPQVRQMYPPDFSTWVVEETLSRGLCGAFRPGHFKGVATVVTKLFNVVQPDLTVFGKKDAQQALIVQRLIRDLNFGIRFVLGETVRAEDGLALSCRNEYLTPAQRTRATSIYRGLTEAKSLFRQGERNSAELKRVVTEAIQANAGRVEYVEVNDRQHLHAVEQIDAPAVMAVAAYFGNTRLIDNVFLEP